MLTLTNPSLKLVNTLRFFFFSKLSFSRSFPRHSEIYQINTNLLNCLASHSITSLMSYLLTLTCQGLFTRASNIARFVAQHKLSCQVNSFSPFS